LLKLRLPLSTDFGNAKLSPASGHKASASMVTTLWALRAAQGRSLKRLCAEKHWAPRTFFRKRGQALGMLAEWLNARAVPVW
jgi:hypothetical protein